MNRSGIVALVVVVASVAQGAPPKHLDFSAHGFTIAPLPTPTAATDYQPLFMMLPATDGFAPNVNVQSQRFSGDIASYDELSLKQFKEMHFTLIDEQLSDKESTFEYVGEQQGRKMHWYARALAAKNGTVILVTATALETQWAAVSDTLKKCVKSLKVTK